MPVAYFCMFENTQRTITRVEIRGVHPEPLIEPPGWIPRCVMLLHDANALGGAEIVLSRMAAEFSSQLLGQGLYGVSYPDMRQWLDDQFARAGDDTPSVDSETYESVAQLLDPLVRISAGIAAAALFVTYIVLNVWATFYWFFYITFRRRRCSPLLTAAETHYLFSILDWSKTIQWLVRVALNSSRRTSELSTSISAMAGQQR